jgi:hypothetical protein
MTRYARTNQFGISRQSFDDVDNLIRSLKTGTREFNSAMDLAAQLLAGTSKAFVQQYYAGPRAPSRAVVGYQKSSFGIPVRQVTGRTLRGWKVRRVAPGVWETYNEERGAYMVEYGIVRGGGGVARRPLKRSGVATLRFIQRTRFAQRIMADTFGNLRNNKGHFRSFQSRIRPFELRMSGIVVSGPQGRLP